MSDGTTTANPVGESGGEPVNVFAQAVEQLVSEGLTEQEATDKVNRAAEKEGAYSLEMVLGLVIANDNQDQYAEAVAQLVAEGMDPGQAQSKIDVVVSTLDPTSKHTKDEVLALANPQE